LGSDICPDEILWPQKPWEAAAYAFYRIVKLHDTLLARSDCLDWLLPNLRPIGTEWSFVIAPVCRNDNLSPTGVTGFSGKGSDRGAGHLQCVSHHDSVVREGRLHTHGRLVLADKSLEVVLVWRGTECDPTQDTAHAHSGDPELPDR
jgi:hypothetical protein